MKNALAKYFLGFFGAIGALLAGLAGYQQVCLRMARKKKDETHVMETYHAKEGEIAYRSVGHGKPLVLVHSMMLGASGREWDAVIDALAEDYHVYVPDLPGFGNSFCPEKPWTAYQYANLLHVFIEDVIGHPVCFCGANGGADFGLLLSLLYAAWCSFPRRASGTALRPTRTRSSFRSCSPPLQARSIFSSAQANGKSEPHWSRRFSQRKPFPRSWCSNMRGRHASARMHRQPLPA
mgnify:CR=1 FL=1